MSVLIENVRVVVIDKDNISLNTPKFIHGYGNVDLKIIPHSSCDINYSNGQTMVSCDRPLACIQVKKGGSISNLVCIGYKGDKYGNS